MQQIKREIDQGCSRYPMPLQASESGRSVWPYGAELAVDIGPGISARQARWRSSGPVKTVAGQQHRLLADDPGVHAIAAEFVPMSPCAPAGIVMTSLHSRDSIRISRRDSKTRIASSAFSASTVSKSACDATATAALRAIDSSFSEDHAFSHWMNLFSA
jgi:hypothetical protein